MTTATHDAFEAWARKECSATDLDLSWNQDGYFTSEWRRACSAWQAATEAEREKRQPLTAEYVCDLWRNARTATGAFTTLETYTAFASAIEAAHGIKA